MEKPEVSSQPSNIGANRDDPLPIPLRLVLNGEGNEIGKPSRCSGSQLKVGPGVFGKVLLEARWGIAGKGGEFSRWNPRKMTLPSFFLK
ncbi:hypothetical protein GOBAR_AA32121 [Gossypium barbadense]|uniref:Uncharacterized protein n=1 Tax=Gossypium barbadense TaxID=3634 RepID=A0A2P5WBU5_GOSBA|nr:hypothetical protein GOBAR_AA32121 [Gossypium barbadense]